MKKVRIGLSIAAIGVVATPFTAHAIDSSSNWGFIVQAQSMTCGYTRATVDNTAKNASETTKNVDPDGSGNCAGPDNTFHNIAAGQIGADVYLVNATRNVLCGSAGPVYSTVAAARITVTANKISSSSCPGGAGEAYHATGAGYKWKASDSTYYTTSRTSPNLNFN